jgi:hypothetical protein
MMIKKLFYILCFLLVASQGWASDCGDADATTWCIESTDTTVDGDTFCGDPSGVCDSGDTLYIEGGARGDLELRDFDGGGSYITIINKDTTRVVMTENGDVAIGVLRIDDCQYIEVRGDGLSSHAWSSGCKTDSCYGIKLTVSGNPDSGMIRVVGESDYIKLMYIEIDMSGKSGGNGAESAIQVQDGDLTASSAFSNFEIAYNYSHHVYYTNMYLGHNQPHASQGDDPYVVDFLVHDNLMEDSGAYGMNLKGVEDGSTGTKIYNNIIRNTGLIYVGEDYIKLGIGISYFYGTAYAEVYDNWVENTVGPGLYIREADHLIYNNTLIECGTGNNGTYDGGIFVSNYDTMPSHPDREVKIYDNIILKPDAYGVYGTSNGDAMLERNLILEAGSGEWSGASLSEGTDTSCNETWGTRSGCPNVVNSDADDICFEEWSDDSDYSNDDFTLCCDYDYEGSCTSGNIKGAQIQGGCINCN